MEFIANYDAKNVFGCFENVEQHALAFPKKPPRSCLIQA